MYVPLSLACLLPRYVIPSVGLSLLLIAVVTAIEEPLVVQILGNRPPELVWLLGSFNVCSACWSLAFAAVVRWSGYHLGVPVSVPSVEHER